MFCPKCGTQAIDGTKFCRSCGSDLDVISAALTGKLAVTKEKLQKNKNCQKEDEDSNDPDKLWGSFIRNSMIGVAFIAIALFLTFSNTIGGSVWGFWLLIPGAGSLGNGISSYLKAKRIKRTRAEFNLFAARASTTPLFTAQSNSALPSMNTKFTDLYAPPARNTGELIMPPGSVTEGTTRHLSHETEHPTALFQKQSNREQ